MKEAPGRFLQEPHGVKSQKTSFLTELMFLGNIKKKDGEREV
jgi:hypothetical protein